MGTRKSCNSKEFKRKFSLTTPPIINAEKRICNNKIRFMNNADIPNVTKLIFTFGYNLAYQMYGNFDIGVLWSTSFISILLEEKGEMMASMFLNNYPNIPSIPPQSWVSWLKNNYQLQLLTPFNCAWVHLFLCKSQMKFELIHAFLMFVFKKFIRIDFVIFVLPPRVPHFQWMTCLGTIISPNIDGESSSFQRLLLIRRTDFVSFYKTRRAVMEDNDDIVALLHKICPRMTKLYGTHYIAEIVSKKEQERQVIVAEFKGTVVAAMILTSQVNYQMLNQCFYLEMLPSFQKSDPTPSQSTEPFNRSDALKSNFLLPPAKMEMVSISDYTLTVANELNENEQYLTSDSADNEQRTSFISIETDFDIDLDVPSSSESSESIDDTEVRFIGHLEINMSCVVLSYTAAEIQKFMGKKGPATSQSEIRPSKLIPFEGQPSCFAIEVMAVATSHSFAVNLLLLAAYECFPDLDCCVMSLPCNERTPPLLKKFVRVNTRREVSIPHELYLCHKLSALGSFSAREAHSQDGDIIADLVGNARSIRVLSMFATSMLDPNSTLRSYVLLCNANVVGFAILDEEYNAEFIFSHYYCEEVLADIQSSSITHGKIMYFTVLPIFEKQSTYFLQELHRLSSYTKLYYSWPWIGNRFTTAVITDMMLAMPILSGQNRQVRDYFFESSLGDNKPVSALFISTPSTCARPRIEINTRIVVVGASDCGLSFVISLLLQSNSARRVHYNNLTIVSAHGVGRYNSTMRVIPATSNLHRATLEMHAFNAYVDVVEGVMTSINRKDRTIIVSNVPIYYDILVLTCGLQYQMPKRSPELRKNRTENPANVFVINTGIDVGLCLTRLKKIWHERQNNVIVYGHCLNAYCCIATLLHIGLPEKCLIFVDFTPQHERLKLATSAIFTDPTIEDAILKNMQSRGVRVYRGDLYTWEFDESERVKSVTFQCLTKRITIDCIAIFAYEMKYVCQTTMQAIQKAGLVFDAGLVISPDFRTNDPAIFAAGTCTKYPSRLYSDNKKHKYYNQMEIGKYLAKVITSEIMGKGPDPFRNFKCSADNKYFVPDYVKPLYVNCILPNEINYFCVRKAGSLASIAISVDGEVMKTGNVKDLEKQGFFRLLINRFGMITEIACLSNSRIETTNLTSVWGKHEVLFKNLYTRFKVGQITDFFKFFSGEEFQAIYHPMFPQLQTEMSNMLMSQPVEEEWYYKPEDLNLFNDILRLFHTNYRQRLNRQHFQVLNEKLTEKAYEGKIIEKVLKFLAEHRSLLPMYAHPLTIKLILAGYNDSDFFHQAE